MRASHIAQELQYWLVDVDPYYTDLLSFDDWRRFCLDIPICASSSSMPASSPSHRFVVCSGKLYVDGLSRMPDGFLADLCKKHGMAYSHQARTGCMMCPLDSRKRAYLLFSFCRSRDTALRHFTRALKALHWASMDSRAFRPSAGRAASRSTSSSILRLARDVQQVYDVHDDHWSRQSKH